MLNLVGFGHFGGHSRWVLVPIFSVNVKGVVVVWFFTFGAWMVELLLAKVPRC